MANKGRPHDETVAIVLGASEFPGGGARITANPAFANSAREFCQYLTKPTGLSLPKESLLDLFDDPGPVEEQDKKLTEFLTAHVTATDILIYYVGHGGFLSDREYFLALRCTEEQRPHMTALRIKALAESLRPLTNARRLYLILDCCFAGDAVKEFQTGEVAGLVTTKTFESLPASGTSLLCAASKDEPAIAPQGNARTMFSESFLEVLEAGIFDKGSMLTLSDVGLATRSLIEGRYGLKAVAPEIHSPRQTAGIIASVPLFPNTMARIKRPDYVPGARLTPDQARRLLTPCNGARRPQGVARGVCGIHAAECNRQ